MRTKLLCCVSTSYSLRTTLKHLGLGLFPPHENAVLKVISSSVVAIQWTFPSPQLTLPFGNVTVYTTSLWSILAMPLVSPDLPRLSLLTHPCFYGFLFSHFTSTCYSQLTWVMASQGISLFADDPQILSQRQISFLCFKIKHPTEQNSIMDVLQ